MKREINTNLPYWLLLFLFIATCSLSSCLPSVNENDRDDTKIGAKLLNNFYKYVANRDFKKIDSMMFDAVKKENFGPNGISGMIKLTEHRLGQFKGYQLKENLTLRIGGQNGPVQYRYKSLVSYEKGESLNRLYSQRLMAKLS